MSYTPPAHLSVVLAGRLANDRERQCVEVGGVTEYLKPSFTVPLGSEAYQEGWERVFGRKRVEAGEETRYLRANGHRFDKGVGADGFIDGTWLCIDCDLRVENAAMSGDFPACNGDSRPVSIEQGGNATLRLKTE